MDDGIFERALQFRNRKMSNTTKSKENLRFMFYTKSDRLLGLAFRIYVSV